MKISRYIALAIGLCIGLAGCSRPLERAMLIGRYSASLGNERQTIQLNENGSYQSVFYRNAAQVWARSGRWTFGPEGAARSITFDGFLFGLTGYNLTGGPGFWEVEPERSWRGKPQLCFDADLTDRCFRRAAS